MKFREAKESFNLKRLCIAWLLVFMVPFLLVNGIALFLEKSFPHCMELHRACAVTVPQLEIVESAIYNASIYGIIALALMVSFKLSSYFMKQIKEW